MKAVVFHDVGDIRLEDVPEPKLKAPSDAIVRITASAICGTDLHMVRGTMPGMKEGTILGHEGVGAVEDIGKGVHNLKAGDRVVIPSTIGCGYCSYCRDGYFAQCDNANPNGPTAGTAFFGGPAETGPFDGLQAEYARIPFANVGLVKVPPEIDDHQAILLSDIFPTAYFGADMAEISPGDTVAVFGCGPVGLFTIVSAFLKSAGRVIAIDAVRSRLDRAAALGAECINFAEDDPVEAIKELTGGIGVDRAIDAVGVDSSSPKKRDPEGEQEVKKIARKTHPENGNWHPGNHPSQAIRWAVASLAKAGTLSVIGVYPKTVEFFPLGEAMNKNLAINMGNCHHRRYLPKLVRMVRAGEVDPSEVLSHVQPLHDAISAYKAFDKRAEGWIKVAMHVGA
ncbi:MAG TPA: zinc-dependent alcohol dehydrogenase [Alphaproteobacteria bacterium]